jgi:prepilin-type N-terminal cleavage/methylation domain-containing protein
MWLSRKKEREKERSFTLIELIIVVVIIAILALVAIPRYFANVTKSQKNAIYANLDAIRQALLGYYAVYGVYPHPNTWPIVVTLDGDRVINHPNLSHTQRSYYYTAGHPYCSSNDAIVYSESVPVDYSVEYCMCTNGSSVCQ